MNSIATRVAESAVPLSSQAWVRGRRYLVGLLLVMTPVGVVMMTDPGLAERYLWTTTIYLFIQSAVLFAALLPNVGPGKTISVTLVVMIVSIAVEYLGVLTGFPFGYYRYSSVLQPMIGGAVPLAIGFAWISVTLAAYLLIANLSRGSLHPALAVLLTASSVLAFDLMLEPFAAFVNGFWTWSGGAVPLQNYAAWFVLGGVFAAVLRVMLPADRIRDRHVMSAAAAVFGVNVLQFSLMNVWHGHAVPVVMSLLVFSAILAVLRSRRHAR